ncbi:MAG: CCA tRNA nucleotidyltransferase [Acidobacteriaceae bacterium]
MPDYIYLLKNRLSIHQRNALDHICEAARQAGMTVFLVGGAVRDLTSGSSVNDLDVAVQGDALKLKKSLEKQGATLWGEHAPSRTLFFRFPVGVRVEISSTRREDFPKPGKPVYHWDTILEDLRRRDFTANAMALSLNEYSYGLLMDPLNGVADIEARQLRLVSNYGFIEDPARLLRATRLVARLGWELEERTRTRFENAKEAQAIEALSPHSRGYELEEITHEEDGLKVLAAMETEGWMHHLFPAWTAAAADTAALEEMRKFVNQLQMQGVSPDISAASAHFLTQKLPPKDLAALKAAFVRPGFVMEWNNLDHAAKEFARQLNGKDAAKSSATWKLFTSADPQAVLWLGLTSKVPAIQAKYKSFFTVWPEARQKIPYALFQELRITPEVTGYHEMMSELFLGVIDGELETEEQLRTFLAPYSPPAPPPPVTIRRARGSRKSGEARNKVAVDAGFDGDIEAEPEPSDLSDDEEAGEEPIEDVEAEEEESEAAVIVPPPVKANSSAPRKNLHQGESVQPAEKPLKKPDTTPPPAAEPVKAPKVHVMTKVAKEATPAASRPGHHAAKPAHAPVHAPAHAPAPSHGAKKALPVKAAPARHAAKPVKPAPAKAARRPAGKVVAPKPAAKTSHPAKKTAAKPAAKMPKKPEPAKRSVAGKKSVPARKHR